MRKRILLCFLSLLLLFSAMPASAEEHEHAFTFVDVYRTIWLSTDMTHTQSFCRQAQCLGADATHWVIVRYGVQDAPHQFVYINSHEAVCLDCGYQRSLVTAFRNSCQPTCII